MVTFVSVRDPIERAESAYNWRKHKCRTEVSGMRCSRLERTFYRCYTTLNAFSEGSCDGSLCGDGWDETSAHVKHLESLVMGKKMRRIGNPVHSCEEARSSMMSIDRSPSTWPPRMRPECRPVGC